MRQIRYAVAMSLDGYIAGPNGEADWIEIDPEVDFKAIWAQFDTLVMGRRTFEAAKKRLGEAAFTGLKTIVFSRTTETARAPRSNCRRRIEWRLGATVANRGGKRYMADGR